MTEQRFADALGVSRGAVQQWEKGDTAPARKHQQAVADLIGVTIGELMSGESSKYPTATKSTHKASEPTAENPFMAMNEVRTLFESMSRNGQREAIEYMRYLATKHPAGPPCNAADRAGDSIPDRPKAA